MTHSTVSNVTQNSFQISWNFENESNVVSKSILIQDSYIGLIKYRNENIPLRGSQVITPLDPNTEYSINFSISGNNNGFAYGFVEENSAKTLAVEQIEQAPNNVTATQAKSSSNTGYWLFGGFTVFLILIAVMKKRGVFS